MDRQTEIGGEKMRNGDAQCSTLHITYDKWMGRRNERTNERRRELQSGCRCTLCFHSFQWQVWQVSVKVFKRGWGGNETAADGVSWRDSECHTVWIVRLLSFCVYCIKVARNTSWICSFRRCRVWEENRKATRRCWSMFLVVSCMWGQQTISIVNSASALYFVPIGAVKGNNRTRIRNYKSCAYRVMQE